MLENTQRPIRIAIGCQVVALIITPPVLQSTAASTTKMRARPRSEVDSISDGCNVFRIEHRDQAGLAAGVEADFSVKLHPIEAPVRGVRVDADDRPLEPPRLLPELRPQKNLDALPHQDIAGRLHHSGRYGARPSLS